MARSVPLFRLRFTPARPARFPSRVAQAQPRNQRSHTMKIIPFLFLLFTSECCFSAVDTNLIAAGDWSAPVGSTQGFGFPNRGTLRGRILLAESPKSGGSPGWHDIAVYLELQECSDLWDGDMDVYCNMMPTVTLAAHPNAQGRETIQPAGGQWELHDGSGRPVPGSPGAFSGGRLGSYWMTIPTDSTVRLRATCYCGGKDKDGRLHIVLPNNYWQIPSRSTKDYFLSCTFTVVPPTNHIVEAGHCLWQGTLVLPPLKIPVQRP